MNPLAIFDYAEIIRYFAATGTSSGFSAAIARMSSVIFIEQYFGPKRLQQQAPSVYMSLSADRESASLQPTGSTSS